MTTARAIWLSALALLALISAAPARAADNLSARGRYRVTLPAGDEVMAVGVWQTLALSIARVDGQRALLRDLTIDGGMPAHGHGLPTAPTVRGGATEGAFLIQGLRFNMSGRWELRILIADEQGTDFAIFQLDAGATASPARGNATWTDDERAVLRSLSIESLSPVPPDATNRVADDPRAVVLGQRLFFDPGLSAGGEISCATCHDPAKHFADGRAKGRGVLDLARNTPSVVAAGYAGFLFWDGRRDSLWSQALGPIEAAAEMNSTRLETVRHVAEHYAGAYEALFGPLPNLGGLPRRASPTGDPEAREAWHKLSAAQQAAIDHSFVDIGKVLAAYERRLAPGRSAFDRYVEAIEAHDLSRARTLLSPKAVAGLKVFISSDAQCLNCHSGPLFTNQGFHNIGTAGGDADSPDFGRAIGIQSVLSSEFSCASIHSDATDRSCPELSFLNRHEENAGLLGAYKVPSLRNAADTAPYMHDGSFASLREVVDHYRNPAHMDDSVEFRPLFDMTPGARDALVAFIQSLRAPVAVPPAL